MNSLANPSAPVAHAPRVSSAPIAAGAIFRRPWLRRRLQHLLVAVLIVARIFWGSPAAAGTMFPELRIANAFGGDYDAHVITAAWYGRAPAWTRASRLEYAVGAIEDTDTSRAYAFFGPVWTLPNRSRDFFVEFSIGPAVLNGSTIDNRELGGNFHFRSALAFGKTFGYRRPVRVALRVSHISNGGLREPNPGFDFIGLSFTAGAR